MRYCAAAFLLYALSGGAAAECTRNAATELPFGQGWGLDLHNTRYQPNTEITRLNVGGLELAWAFRLDGGMSPHSYFVVTSDTIFIGTPAGTLWALNREDGCVRWRSTVEEAIRTGIAVGQIPGGTTALFFGTVGGTVHAMDAATGEHLWDNRAKQHPFGMLTGTPSFHDGTLYVPVSSGELGLAVNPLYGCCKFRGSVVAMDAATGEHLWRTHTIDAEATVQGQHWLFVEEWGPSGAPIWLSPTIDPDLGLLFVGTGENYTAPASGGSDAIIALRLADGQKIWVQQYTANDTFNMACVFTKKHPNCPDEAGPDLDFGAPPIRAIDHHGQPILLAGQKSGDVHAIAPATGQRLWTKNLGRGGYLGGVHWGMAIHPHNHLLYVPISDIPAGDYDGAPKPGIHALDLTTGERQWLAKTPDLCGNKGDTCRVGMSAAITVTPEVLFAGALDGMFYAFDAQTGDVLWETDTWTQHHTVNGDPAEGGAIDVHGPFVTDREVLIQSGYQSFGQKGGNALLVYRLPKEVH